MFLERLHGVRSFEACESVEFEGLVFEPFVVGEWVTRFAVRKVPQDFNRSFVADFPRFRLCQTQILEEQIDWVRLEIGIVHHCG